MNLGFGVFHWMALVTLLVTARKSNSLKCYFTYNCRSYEHDGASERCIEGGKLEIYRKNFILKNDTHANTCIIILFFFCWFALKINLRGQIVMYGFKPLSKLGKNDFFRSRWTSRKKPKDISTSGEMQDFKLSFFAVEGVWRWRQCLQNPTLHWFDPEKSRIWLRKYVFSRICSPGRAGMNFRSLLFWRIGWEFSPIFLDPRVT